MGWVSAHAGLLGLVQAFISASVLFVFERELLAGVVALIAFGMILVYWVRQARKG